jgi:ApbE superfamily uncharacterized protein (UPF0280 family)
MIAQRHQLDANRWHFQHGPMDVIVGGDGHAGALQHAHEAAWQRFKEVLNELVTELPVLRRAVVPGPCPLQGRVAQRMWAACAPHAAQFITPMAAVAGSVAQELMPYYATEGITRAWANNGGDIALYMAPGASLTIGLVADVARVQRHGADLKAMGLDGRFTVTHAMAVRGVATSGWRGRSFSLGIADSVTVLAHTAAQADAAASMVANAVNVRDARIERAPACQLKDDTDLGNLPVTVHVPKLDEQAVRAALSSGLGCANRLRALGLLQAAILVCQGQMVACGALDGAALTDPRDQLAGCALA